MAENNLYQLAQVVTELPTHHQSLVPNSRLGGGRSLAARKNACIVCAICFTCSGYYGENCRCSEIQPRRGKNLPEGGLDSRAKKLTPHDKEDYEFTLKWLDEFAHKIYRNHHNNVIGLNEMTEVSLCKAHSSTLYRAKKKHQRQLSHQAPPSPADSNGMEESKNRSSSVDSFLLLPQPQSTQPPSQHYYNHPVGGGALAAKVREISFQQYNRPPPPPPIFPQDNMFEPPDFIMTSSSSTKRKRTSMKPPNSSASTPLLYSNNNTSLFNKHHSVHPVSRQPTSSFSSQLPPLHLCNSVNSLSSNLHQLQVTPNNMKVIETVSLKSSPTLHHHSEDTKMDEDEECVYYIKNLAITDDYTFRDLLSEIDFAGTPPPGKRIVISDLKRERIFPLGQAIRSVIRYPTDTHMEFYLGLAEKASINWNHYK